MNKFSDTAEVVQPVVVRVFHLRLIDKGGILNKTFKNIKKDLLNIDPINSTLARQSYPLSSLMKGGQCGVELRRILWQRA